MNIFLYCIIFIMGTVFGSFYTLAVYRIPKGQDITHTHSYCPNCNHKLGFIELIPVLSYIFLGGKCKHCKQKIRPRYLILEISSGLCFLLFAIALKLNIYNLNIHSLTFFAFLILYLTCVILIAGIDKEYRKINKSVLAYGIVISVIYIVYLYILEKASIYRYIMYLLMLIILLFVENIMIKKQGKDIYFMDLLILTIIMVIFTGEYVTINTIIITLLAISINLLINKFKKKNKKEDIIIIDQDIKFGYLLTISNLIILFVVLFFVA